MAILSPLVQRLVEAPVVVVLDEVTDRTLHLPRTVVLVQPHHVQHRAVVRMAFGLHIKGGDHGNAQAMLLYYFGDVR